MSGNFETVVGALWASLGLPRPRIVGKAEVVLTVDGRSVTLALSPDERHILVAAVLGPLSSDPVRQDQQLRRMLRESLGLLTTNRAGLGLRADTGSAGSVGPVAAIEAIGPCRVDAAGDLTRLIEDVLQLLDIHGATLNQVSDRRMETEIPVTSEESLIFRL